MTSPATTFSATGPAGAAPAGAAPAGAAPAGAAPAGAPVPPVPPVVGAGLPRLLRGLAPDGRAIGLDEHLARWGEPPRLPGGRPAPPVLDAADAAGLRGRGGGGFPVGRKMRAVLAAAGDGMRSPVVVANGAESEPASAKDAVLLSRVPHLVLDGLAAAAAAVGAHRAVLAVHRGDPCLPFVRAAAAERMSRRPDQVPVELADVPTGYVTSEETALVNWLNGVAALPTVAPPRPAQRGVGHAPTLVQNVETLAHLALVARFGPGWFRALGTAADPGTMLLTVHGTRDTAGGPGVYEVPGGARAADVLAAAGGLPSGCPGVLVGGYGGRWLPADVLLGTTLDAAGLGGPLGCGLLLALPPGACGVRELARVGRWMAGESAGQCGPCAFGLPAISGTLDLLAAGRLDAAGFARLSRWTGQVRGRGACRHPDGTAQFVDSGLATFASEVDAHLRGGCAADPRVGPVCPLRDTDDPALLQRQAGGGTGWWR